jgi:hypothetical protein
MQQLLQTIQFAGAFNICIIGGLNWAKDYSGFSSNSVTGINVAYAAHLYGNQVGDTISAFSSQVAPVTGYGPIFIGEMAPKTTCGADDPTYDTNIFTWIGSPAISGGTAWSMTTNSCPNLYTGNFAPNAWGSAVINWLATPPPNCIFTPTPTPTDTPCGYPGNTCTPTNTPTPTDTPTATPTPNPNADILFPNPWDGTVPLCFYHNLTTPADSVNVKVFSISFRKIAEIDGYPAAVGQYPYYIFWEQMGNVANGLYYVVIEENRGHKQTQKVLKLLVKR